MGNDIFGAVDAFINQQFLQEDQALIATREAIMAAGLPPISISENQGKFIHMLALLKQPKRILEIGTLGGYSTIWLARALQPGGKLITLELDPHHAAIARTNFAAAGLADTITVRVGNALEELPKLKAEDPTPFDAVFIDADKEPYADYFRWALQLSSPGSLIIVDNVVREGKILDASTRDSEVKGVQNLIKLLSQSNEVTATIIQTVGSKYHDGIALAVVN